MGVELPRIGQNRTTVIRVTSLRHLRRLVVLTAVLNLATLILLLVVLL